MQEISWFVPFIVRGLSSCLQAMHRQATNILNFAWLCTQIMLLCEEIHAIFCNGKRKRWLTSSLVCVGEEKIIKFYLEKLLTLNNLLLYFTMLGTKLLDACRSIIFILELVTYHSLIFKSSNPSSFILYVSLLSFWLL